MNTLDISELESRIIMMIHQRYPYLDINKISLSDHNVTPMDYIFPDTYNGIYSDPIIWFRYEDKKYIMIEQLYRYTLNFPEELARNSIPEEIKFDPEKCLERLYEFYEDTLTELTNQKIQKYFPKLLKWGRDFIIFEYVPNNQLMPLPRNEISNFKFIKANREILKVTKDFRPRNNIECWSIRDNHIFYTNITKFILLPTKCKIKNISIANEFDQLI